MAPQNFDRVENASFLLDACSREFNTERVFSRRDLSEHRKGVDSSELWDNTSSREYTYGRR
jgi:hypothetical protein